MKSLQVIELIRKIGAKIIENKDFLTELDRPIGDNDHGINMARGFEAVDGKLTGLEEKDVGTVLKTTGMTLVSTVGGYSVPLYGTLFMKMGMALKDNQDLSFPQFLEAFHLDFLRKDLENIKKEAEQDGKESLLPIGKFEYEDLVPHLISYKNEINKTFSTSTLNDCKSC